MSIIDRKAREYSRPLLVAVANRLDKWHVTPNMATYFGMVLTTGVAVLAALGEIRWAGVAYIFAAVCGCGGWNAGSRKRQGQPLWRFPGFDHRSLRGVDRLPGHWPSTMPTREGSSTIPTRSH